MLTFLWSQPPGCTGIGRKDSDYCIRLTEAPTTAPPTADGYTPPPTITPEDPPLLWIGEEVPEATGEPLDLCQG